jgi:hypothetical protein
VEDNFTVASLISYALTLCMLKVMQCMFHHFFCPCFLNNSLSVGFQGRVSEDYVLSLKVISHKLYMALHRIC